MGTLLGRALATGLLGLVLGPLAAFLFVLGLLVFDPACGVGDSGGCAMGLVTVPVSVAVPSFLLGVCVSLGRSLRARRGPR